MDKSKFQDKREWKKFGISLSIILMIIASLLLIKGKEFYPYLFGAGIFIIILAFLIPILLKPIYILFSYIGFCMGWFITRITLSILFYLILTPIGLISKLFGKHYLDLKFKEDTESCWITKEHKLERGEDFKNQF